MQRKPAKTHWDTVFDSEPTSDAPRIVFAKHFSHRYIDSIRYQLDIGCGTGVYTKQIDRKGTIGIDLDLNAVKIAMRSCPNSEFVVCSALHLPFKQQTFGLAFMWEVFEEIPVSFEAPMVMEVERILSNNSTLLLSTSYDHVISKLLDPAYVFGGVRHYKTKELSELIGSLGFHINECATRGYLFSLISNFLVFFYKHALHKKDDRVKRFFDKKSKNEFFQKDKGIVYIFIAAEKKK